MSNKFKVGDKVICIDPGDYKHLIRDDIYTVDEVDKEYVGLKILNSGTEIGKWLSYRFVSKIEHEFPNKLIELVNEE